MTVERLVSFFQNEDHLSTLVVSAVTHCGAAHRDIPHFGARDVVTLAGTPTAAPSWAA
jgi:hypothetical protein